MLFFSPSLAGEAGESIKEAGGVGLFDRTEIENLISLELGVFTCYRSPLGSLPHRNEVSQDSAKAACGP